MFVSKYVDVEPQIKDIFLHKLGWEISLEDVYTDKKIETVCKNLGFTDIRECILAYSKEPYSQKITQALAKEFSIGETYFFRDKKFFETFENKIIPLLKQNTTINIWSVGCASGEEAYSISMLLHKNIPDINQRKILILGTDINTEFLEKAKIGQYRTYSFREIPPYYKKRYFKKIDNAYEILPIIKQNVHFAYHNITSTKLPLKYEGIIFDLILLNNVLIYFDKEKAKEVVDFLYTMIKVNGWLSTTCVEYATDTFSAYRAEHFSNEHMIQKNDAIKRNLPIHEEVPFLETSALQEEVIETQEAIIEEKIFDNNPLTYYLKAAQLLEEENIQEAKETLRKCLYLENNFLVGLILLGNILQKEGDRANSLKHITKAKELLMAMNASDIVDFSGDMRAEDLLVMINYQTIQQEGLNDGNT